MACTSVDVVCMTNGFFSANAFGGWWCCGGGGWSSSSNLTHWEKAAVRLASLFTEIGRLSKDCDRLGPWELCVED